MLHTSAFEKVLYNGIKEEKNGTLRLGANPNFLVRKPPLYQCAYEGTMVISSFFSIIKIKK